MEKSVETVFNFIKTQYLKSEVVSGEFIYSLRIPKDLNGLKLNTKDVKKGVQEFLNWDESPEVIHIMFDNTNQAFYSTPNTQNSLDEYDSIEYNGKEYTVRTFNVEVSNGNYEATYMIAPESLYDAIVKKEGEDFYDEDGEGTLVDNAIYHYVEDDVFLLDAKEICAKHLDIPMKFISEITY